MANFKDEDKINDLRERLYSRGIVPKKAEPFALKATPKKVATTWQQPPEPKNTADSIPVQQQQESSVAAPAHTEGKVEDYTEGMAPKRNKKYRLIIVAAAFIFFIVSAGVSSLFFFFGNNTISGENIAIDINGPFTVGGGEAIPLQIAVTNQNTVAIDSATLIVTYPPSTQSITEVGKALNVERLPLDTVEPGETLNIPLRALVFGEENDEKTIRAEIEYRVQGSNSTFAREAEPLRFKIGSSPVVINVDALKKISSGQETSIELKLISNSQNTLTNILVKADYPLGFDYTKATPEPVSGQNVWLIEELAPEGETTIEIEGIIVGKESDEYSINYSVGVADESNPLALSSIFSTTFTDFEIEQPFLDVELLVNSSGASVVPIDSGDSVSVTIAVTNTLEDIIYDALLELKLSGNALSDFEVNSSKGFYDSVNDVIRWVASDNENLRQIDPGEKIEFSMSLKPDPDIVSAPQLMFDVSVKAQRLAERQVSEQLLGTAAAAVRVKTQANLASEVSRNTSIFTEKGPIPPVAEKETSYTITLLAENSTNDISDTVVTASLPTYVEWADKTTGAGTFEFNDNSRVVTWKLGSVDANQSKLASFQVTFLPSKSQIGTTPTLLGEQRLRATDLFTGQVIRSSRAVLRTSLPAEAGFSNQSGEVQAE